MEAQELKLPSAPIEDPSLEDEYDPKGYVPPVHEVEIDKEGYLKSFSLDEGENIRNFFNNFGFVVIRDVFNPEECTATIDDIWNYIKKNKIDRNDRETWSRRYWSGTGLAEEGIIGFDCIFTHRTIQNRQNPNLHKAASIILGSPNLLVNHDRYGLFRPTKASPTAEIERSMQSMYNIHLDMNPWHYVFAENSDHSHQVLDSLKYKSNQDFITENNEPGCLKQFELNIQCLVNLADNHKEDGGFQVIPGFHHHLADFVQHSKDTLGKRFGTRSTFIILPVDQPLHKNALRVTARAGSMVIWDQRVAHGSAPNCSHNARYAQFFKIFYSNISPSRAERRSAAVKRELAKVGFTEVTPLGEKLFGLKPWD